MSDLLSQDEIDALLKGVTNQSDDSSSPISEEKSIKTDTNLNNDTLTSEEIDVLGEIGNISMGAAATALSEILGQAVKITTPKVAVMDWEELMQQYPKPYVVTKVQYAKGLLGSSLLIIQIDDVKVLTNLMLGEDPHKDREIGEMELSAIAEAMNQMIGSSCTSISSMINKKIDITPPIANVIDFRLEEDCSKIYENEKVVKISFRMIVGNLIDSELMQLLPLSFAKDLVKSMLNNQSGKSMPSKPAQQANTAGKPQSSTSSKSEPSPVRESQFYQQPAMQYTVPPQNMNAKAQETAPREPVNVQPVQFQPLEDTHFANYKENIGLIMDVPLEVTVELGRASRMIREILEFGPGSIVELDKLAGEPVDILVNGKIIAKGEVVVIDENFGVRITDIIHPSKRL